MKTPTPATPTAYSYIRFSNPDQADGDSLRRQSEMADAYCRRKGWTLSRATYQDLGVSARKGKNPATNMGEGCMVLTRRLPAWIEERGGKPHLIPERAAVVKRIFQLAASGYGFGFIVKKVTEDGVPPFNEARSDGKQKGWM